MISYANRGKVLEELITWSNNQYEARGIALIRKIPTPIKPLKILKNGKVIAFFAEKSTLDYMGVHKGTPLAFDAKETRETDRFPLQNIQEHQMDFMENWTQNGGIAFLIINFVILDKVYRIDYQTVKDYWDIWQQNRGRKGFAYIPLLEFKRKGTLIESESGIALNYLRGLLK